MHSLCIFLILFLNPFLLFEKTISSSSSQINAKKNLSASSSSPLLFFLNNLIDAKKGYKAKGVAELKKHLTNLGYMSNNNNSQPAARDLFDDELEEALKKYQTVYGLRVTGTLNLETVKSLSLPKCGVPDHFNHINSSKLKNRTAALASSLYTFLEGGEKWPTRYITYSILDKGSPDFTRVVLDKALYMWANATGKFSFTYDSYYDNADIRISFQIGDHGDENPFDGPGGVLAHSSGPNVGDLHFDGAEDWVNGVEKDKYDLRTLALHELGHVLGLGHSDDKRTIMYHSFDTGKRKHLTPDDVAGIIALYR